MSFVLVVFIVFATTLLATSMVRADVFDNDFVASVCSTDALGTTPQVTLYDSNTAFSELGHLRPTSAPGPNICDAFTRSSFAYQGFTAERASCAVLPGTGAALDTVLLNIALANSDDAHVGTVSCVFQVEVFNYCFVPPSPSPTPAIGSPTPKPESSSSTGSKKSSSSKKWWSSKKSDKSDKSSKNKYAKKLQALKAVLKKLAQKYHGKWNNHKRAVLQATGPSCSTRTNRNTCLADCAPGPLGRCSCIWDHPDMIGANEQGAEECPPGRICCFGPPCARWSPDAGDAPQPPFLGGELEAFCNRGGGGDEQIEGNCVLLNNVCQCRDPLTSSGITLEDLLGVPLDTLTFVANVPFDCGCPFLPVSIWIAFGAAQVETPCQRPDANAGGVIDTLVAPTSLTTALSLQAFQLQHYDAACDTTAVQITSSDVENDPAVQTLCAQLLGHPVCLDQAYTFAALPGGGCELIVYNEIGAACVAEITSTAQAILSDSELLPAGRISVRRRSNAASLSSVLSFAALAFAALLAAL
jgi:hypothetical protein